MHTSAPRRVLAVGAVTAAAAAAAALLAAPSQARPSSSSAAEAFACTLVSPAQVRSILGLAQTNVMRDVNGTSAAAEAQTSECGVVAWSGSTPSSMQTALQTAKSGHGAQVGLETWAPHQGSPDVRRWISKDFAKLTRGFTHDATTFPVLFAAAGSRSKPFKPSPFGQQAAGFTAALTGQTKGLVTAAGCWWSNKKSSAFCLFDEEAAGKPVVAHLNALARIAVAKFLT